MHGSHARGERFCRGVIREDKGMQEGLVENVPKVAKMANISRRCVLGGFDFECEVAGIQFDEKVDFTAVEGSEIGETSVGVNIVRLLVELGNNHALEFESSRTAALLNNRLQYSVIQHMDFG